MGVRPMGIRRRASQPIGCTLLARGKRVERDVVPRVGKRYRASVVASERNLLTPMR